MWRSGLRTHLSMRRIEASQICLCMLEHITHCTVANRLSLPHALHILIHCCRPIKVRQNQTCGKAIFDPLRKMCNYFMTRRRKSQHAEPDSARLCLPQHTACSSVLPALSEQPHQGYFS